MKKKCLQRIITVLLSFAVIPNMLAIPAAAAHGDFDETFGPGGSVQFGTHPYLYSGLYSLVRIWGLVLKTTVLAMQPDGKILVAAATDAPQCQIPAFLPCQISAVVRYSEQAYKWDNEK